MPQDLALAFGVFALLVSAAALYVAVRSAKRTRDIEELLSVPEPETPPVEDWRRQTL